MTLGIAFCGLFFNLRQTSPMRLRGIKRHSILEINQEKFVIKV